MHCSIDTHEVGLGYSRDQETRLSSVGTRKLDQRHRP